MPEDNLDAVRGHSVLALRWALSRGSGVGEALRWCSYRNPMFALMLFQAAVLRRFGAADTREVTRFVAGIQAGQPADALGFPRREAEAIMRWALGETRLAFEVHPDRVNYLEIGVAVLARLFQERPPGHAEVASLFAQAEENLRILREQVPVTDAAEDAWFAEGWHDSPFAVPMADDETESRADG